MYQYRRTRKRYARANKADKTSDKGCTFCTSEIAERSLIEGEHTFLVPNRVFYDAWELNDVVDHLLLIPKQHAKSLAGLSDEARQEIMHMMATYEAKGYNIYARGVGSVMRSVKDHQHTHFIKTNNKKSKFALFLEKPYLLIKR